MRLAAAILAVGAIAAIIAIGAIPLDPWAAEELITPRTLPGIGAALLLCGALLLWWTPAPGGESRAHAARAPGLAVGALIAALLVPWTGIWVATGLLIAAGALWLGERRPLLVTLGPAAITATLWLLVEVGLGIDLPTPALASGWA